MSITALTLPQQVTSLLRAGSGLPEARRTGELAMWRAKRIFSYIEDNLASRIVVAHLARQAGLSHGHLMRSFKMRFGITIRNYILCRRLAAAQYQMMMTKEPLCEIALQCGMCDQSHFSRVFRRFVGLSPSRWREIQLDARSRDHACPMTSGTVGYEQNLQGWFVMVKDGKGSGLRVSLCRASASLQTTVLPQERPCWLCGLQNESELGRQRKAAQVVSLDDGPSGSLA